MNSSNELWNFAGVVPAVVKHGLDCQGGRLLSKDRAHGVIRESAEEAVRRRGEVRPYRVSTPVTLRLELVSRGAVPAGKLGVRVVDGRTYEVTGETLEEALTILL